MKQPFDSTQQIVMDELKNTMNSIDELQVESLIAAINNAEKVFFVGVGRVLLSLEAIAKRLAHLGIQTVIVGEITEPAITDKDLLIVGSGSGKTMFPLGIAKKAKQFGAKVAHIGANPESPLSEFTDVFVRIPVQTKLYLPDEIPSQQIMTSLFEQSLLLLGDTIALMMVKDQNIDLKSLWQYHANLE